MPEIILPSKAEVEAIKTETASIKSTVDTNLDGKISQIKGGLQPREQIFTTSGPWTRPTGVTSVEVVCVGGGGAGAGSSGFTSRKYAGGGGGGGAYVKKIVQVSANQTITIGSGGTSTAGQAGAPGGTTSFGSLVTAGGGGGGGTLTGQNAPTNGGGGGGFGSSAGSSGQDYGGGGGGGMSSPGESAGLYRPFQTARSGNGYFGCQGSGVHLTTSLETGRASGGGAGIDGMCGGGAGGRSTGLEHEGRAGHGGGSSGSHGRANSGGGGGGGNESFDVNIAGGNGGSGICIVRWWE